MRRTRGKAFALTTILFSKKIKQEREKRPPSGETRGVYIVNEKEQKECDHQSRAYPDKREKKETM